MVRTADRSWQASVVVVAAAVAGAVAAGGALAYLYALSGYTARVFFPAAIDRAHEPRFVSALAYSPNMKLFYLACFLGWLLGLVSLSGRPRLLVAAAMISFGCFVAYAIAFLVLANAPWSLPIPAYVEQGLFPLYLAAAVAGYWGALAKTCSAASRFAAGGGFASLAPAGVPALRRLAALIASILTIAAVPAAAASYALTRAGAVDEPYLSRPPDEPELGKFFADRLGLALGQPFRGSVLFWSGASWDGMVETDYARAILS